MWPLRGEIDILEPFVFTFLTVMYFIVCYGDLWFITLVALVEQVSIYIYIEEEYQVIKTFYVRRWEKMVHAFILSHMIISIGLPSSRRNQDPKISWSSTMCGCIIHIGQNMHRIHWQLIYELFWVHLTTMDDIPTHVGWLWSFRTLIYTGSGTINNWNDHI